MEPLASTTAAAGCDIGDRIGPYRLVRQIGRGGQGVVFLAQDSRLDRKVALKIIPRSEATIGGLARLKREASLLAGLSHPGLRAVLDFAEAGEAVYIAFPYLEGETLASRLSGRRISTEADRTPPQKAAPRSASEERTKPEDASSGTPGNRREIDRLLLVFEKLARALHVAHESGVVHRDLKPANLFLTTDGEPVILDFGLARAFEDDSGLTATGALLGTPAYVAPECASGHRVADRRSDLWSLAVSLFECLTGRRPFDGPSHEALLRAICETPTPDPRTLNKEIPSDLRVVLEVALEKNPDRRYVTAAAFADDLAAVRERRPVAAKPIGPIGRLVRFAARAPAQFALAVVLIVAPTTGAALFALREADRPRAEAESRARAAANLDTAIADAYLLISDDRPKEAYDALVRLRSGIAPTAEVEATVALAALDARMPAEALDAADRLAASIGRSFASETLRISALTALGRKNDADRIRASRPAAETALDSFVRAKAILPIGTTNAGPEVYRPALADLQRAVLLARRPRVEHHAALAHAAGRCDDIPAARAAAAAMRQHWPRSPGAMRAAGLGLGLAGADEEALAFYEESLRLDPGEVTTYINYAVSLVESGRGDDAIRVLEEARKTVRPESQLREALGYHLLRKRDAVQSLAHYDSVLAEFPKRMPSVAGRMQALVILGRDADAVAVAAPIASQFLDDYDFTFAYGTALRNLLRFEEAIPVLEIAVKLEPDIAGPVATLSRCLYMVGRIDEALATTERTLAIDPRNAAALSIRGTHRLSTGAAADAETDLKTSILVESTPAARLPLIRILMATGRPAEAIPLAREGPPSLRTAHATVRLQLAECLLRTGDPAGASAAVEESTATSSVDQRRVGARTRIIALRLLGRDEDSAEAARLAAAKDPSLGRDLSAYAIELRDQGYVDLASLAYASALLIDPGNAFALTNLASLEWSRGRFAEAARLAEAGEASAVRKPADYPSSLRRKSVFFAALADAEKVVDARNRGKPEEIPDRPGVVLRALIAADAAVDAVRWWNARLEEAESAPEADDQLTAANAAAIAAADLRRTPDERAAFSAAAARWFAAGRADGMVAARAGKLGAKQWRRSLRSIAGDSYFAPLVTEARRQDLTPASRTAWDAEFAALDADARRLEYFLLSEVPKRTAKPSEAPSSQPAR